MCEANVYIKNKDEEEYELLLEAVDKLVPGEDEIVMESIFGERKIVKARIENLSLVDHKILLERI